MDEVDPKIIQRARVVIASNAIDAADAALIMQVLGIGYERFDADGILRSDA